MKSPGSSTRSPFQRISPCPAAYRPSTPRSSVVFPDPTSPVTTVTVPGLIVSDTSRTPRSVPGNTCVSDRISSSRSGSTAGTGSAGGGSALRCSGWWSTSVIGGAPWSSSAARTNDTPDCW